MASLDDEEGLVYRAIEAAGRDGTFALAPLGP